MPEENNWNDLFVAKLLYVVLIAWGILAIIFAITDLEISKAVVNPDSYWGYIGYEYGVGPSWSLIGICLAILIGSSSENLTKQKIFGISFGFLGIIIFLVGIAINQYYLIFYGGYIGIPTLFFSLIMIKKDFIPMKTIASVVLLVGILNNMLFVNIIKEVWGRVRFRDLTPPNYPEYTPWYVINWGSDSKSFPSGHAAAGWLFFPLLILLKDRSKKDPIRIILTVVIVGWGLFVAASRVVLGAHFMSDVLFSSALTIVLTIIFYKKFYFNKVK